MAYTTLPGVRVTIADGFFPANDATVDGLADRVLIVARAGFDASPTVLRDPSRIWKNESEVVSAFGSGSDVHIAFNSAVKGGAGNIFISATDPSPAHSTLPTDLTAAGTTLANITQDEYEFYLALEHASLASPGMLVPYGYPANARVSDTANIERLSYYTAIAAQKCLDLTNDVSPCFATMSVATFEDWYELQNAALISQAATLTLSLIDGISESTVKYVIADTTYSRWVATGNPVLTDSGTPVTSGFYIDYDEMAVYFDAPPAGAVTLNNFWVINDSDAYSGTYPVPATDVKTFADYLVGSTIPAANKLTPETIQATVDSVETILADTGLSKFLVLVVGDVKVNNQEQELGLGLSEYINANAIVAGNIHRQTLDQAITMQPMYNVSALAFDMTPAQKIAIINKGAIPLGVSPSGFLVTVDGVTAAIADDQGNTSLYNRLSTLRVVHEVIRGTRGVLEPFVGTTASTARLNSIETKLRAYYLALKQQELAKEVRFEMRYTISTSTLSVAISVIPYGEIRDIEVTVDVQLQ